MEVKKLYYADCHMQTFSAVVTGCTPVKDGYAITLDATAFYPEGGGQPCDTGSLGDAVVSAVYENGDTVVHLCDKPLAEGSTVVGTIDWARRFDFMQQHSGEHMVSGVIHRRYGYHNVGFHMGEDVVTVDFDGWIPQEALQEIEDAVNVAIWQNIPVRCYYPTEAELSRLPYRRKKDLPFPVRIVEIPNIDLCACCGTQVEYTGEIGLVKLLTCVKFHEGARIEMVCGKRALDLLGGIYHQNRQVSQMLSAKMQETVQAVRQMQESLTAEKFRSTGLEKRLFAYIAQSYAGKAFALHFEDGLSPAENRALCDQIAKACTVAVTLSGTDTAGYSLCIISRTEDAKAIGSPAVRALQGRGGGKAEVFQGSLSATRKEIEKYFCQQA